MTRFGLFLGVLSAAIAALLVTIAYSSGTSRWLAVAGTALLSGLIVGLLLGRRRKVARARHAKNREALLSDAGIIDFSPKLLDATINEMREGLLVIDQEMRVVASNRAARNLFSHVDDSINQRRLTELT